MPLVTGLLGALLAGLCPLALSDDEASSALLTSFPLGQAPQSTLVLRVSSKAVRQGECAERLQKLLAPSQGALVLSPLGELCPIGQSKPPALPFSRAQLKLSPQGIPVGLNADAWQEGQALGLRSFPWTRSAKAASVPELTLEDLESGRLSAALLKDKLVVAALSETGPAKGFAPASEIAAVVDAVRSGQGRSAIGRLWVLALGAVLGTVTALFWQHARTTKALVGTALLGLSPLVLQLALVLVPGASMLPIASVELALLVCTALVVGQKARRLRFALARANHLMGRAALFRARGLEELSGPELFAKLGELAAQCHPCEQVIVGELAPYQWHLRLWTDGESAESVVAEMRRDVRRTPYCEEDGLAAPRVVEGFLADPKTPVLIVPLLALGELEGYVFLCGESAKQAFEQAPDRTSRLSRELALMLRRRRLTQAQTPPWLIQSRPQSSSYSDSPTLLATHAQAVLEELTDLSAVLRQAPVGLAYADSFGQVRLMGGAWLKWLSQTGMQLPEAPVDGVLAPGALELFELLQAISPKGQSAGMTTLDQLLRNPQGIEVQIAPSASQPALRVMVQALRHVADGMEVVGGFLATLIEEPAGAQGSLRPGAQQEAQSFAVGELLSAASKAVEKSTGRKIQLEVPEGTHQALGNGTAISQKLTGWLTEATKRSASDKGPEIVVQDKAMSIDIRLSHVFFGLPRQALEGTLQSPSTPAAGLEKLGQLAIAVQGQNGVLQLWNQPDGTMGLRVRLIRVQSVTKGNRAENEVVAVGF